MSKASEMLDYFKAHVGEWSCVRCATRGNESDQTAAVFRKLKDDGWSFEEHRHQRWARTMRCEECDQDTTHYKLTSLEKGAGNSRGGLTQAQRDRIIRLIGRTDAFSGATVVSSPEVDHKEPFRRLREKGHPDPDPDNMSDSQIAETYQILTRDHNLLKDRACQGCQDSFKRPPLLGINFWYEGDSQYRWSCKGCGWYDGAEWRRRLNERLGRS